MNIIIIIVNRSCESLTFTMLPYELPYHFQQMALHATFVRQQQRKLQINVQK